MLRGPSRLREVYNLDADLASEGTIAETMGNAVTVGDSVEYEIGAEVTAFAEVFSRGWAGDVFGESGILANYYSIGQDVLESLQEDEDETSDSSHHWRLECRTWDLVQRLYIERTKENLSSGIAHEYLSNSALEQNLYEVDSQAAEIKVVLDWCQDGAINSGPFENRGNRWFYTKENIRARERQGKLGDSQGIISELDPDAPTRQGKRLVEEDMAFERNLTRAMFIRIRAGDYQEAAEVARQSGNYWRAASLRGCVEYRNSVLDGTGEIDESEGNANKALWRRMCFALARQPGIDVYERAMYGALCGDISSVLPVCSSWDDRLWANYNAINQSKVEAHLRSHKRIDPCNEFTIEDSSHLTSGVVLDTLLRSENELVRREAKSSMRIIQARIITNQLEALLLDIQEQLLSIRKGGPPNAGSNPHVVRFVAHLVLALRQMNIPVPEEAASSVLQAYVELLTSAGKGNIVALYASHLPEAIAVESLARHLALVEDQEQRLEQLRLADEHGIKISPTILRTVDLVFEELLTDTAITGGLQPSKEEPSPEELRCIRALEWTKLDETIQTEAIKLGNILFRKFLLCGRLAAARTLANKMPDSLLIPRELSADTDHGGHDPELEVLMRDAIEYVGYCTLVRALSRYEDWKLLVRQRPEEINGRRDPVGLRQWKADVASVKLECTMILREIVDGAWCDPEELGLPREDRELETTNYQYLADYLALYEEFITLRTMYLPDVILKLHGVYSAQEGRDVAAAMDLAVLVSERLSTPMKRSGSLAVYVTEISMLGAYLI